MSVRRLLGTINVKDGCICLQRVHEDGESLPIWYPLGGNSHIAMRFQESFGEPSQSDIGKQLWRVGDIYQMENREQMLSRLAMEKQP